MAADIKLYIHRLYKVVEDEGLFEMSNDDYINPNIFIEICTENITEQNKNDANVDLTDTIIRKIIQESRAATVKNTIDFLSVKKILEASGMDHQTGEFVYTLTKAGKTLYRKLMLDEAKM